MRYGQMILRQLAFLATDTGACDDEAYGAVCLLAGRFVEGKVSQSDISPIAPENCAPHAFLASLAELCHADEIQRDTCHTG
jgi:hypothetical protein